MGNGSPSADSMKRRNLVYILLAVVMAGLAMALAGPGLAQTSSQGAPPLRGLVQESRPIIMPEATAYSLFTQDANSSHQVWYRISGGDALFRQRLRVYQEQASPRPQNQLPPDTALRHELTSNTPTGWFVLPTIKGVATYYFDGDHRIDTQDPWESGRGVRLKHARFSNGDLYELGFEDQISLDDYNDLEIQVAVVRSP